MTDPTALRHEINRLILHPMGLSLQNLSVKKVPTDVHIQEPSPACAITVANAIESNGQQRLEELGYVVQRLAPEVKQLHVTVRELVEQKG